MPCLDEGNGSLTTALSWQTTLYSSSTPHIHNPRTKHKMNHNNIKSFMPHKKYRTFHEIKFQTVVGPFFVDFQRVGDL